MKNGTRRIALTQGKFAIVDACDFAFISSFNWYALKHRRTFGYYWCAARFSKGNQIYMHREIMKRVVPKEYKRYDHRDRNGLNNSLENIRPCTQSQNGANRTKTAGTSSRYKGVKWNKFHGKWQAAIKVNYKDIHLGYFIKEIDAHRAYVAAAIHYFGEFAAA